MLLDYAADWLAGDSPWPDHAQGAPAKIVAGMLAHCVPDHLLEATPQALAFALLAKPRHQDGPRLHGKRSSPVAQAAGALAYGLAMLEQSCPRAWEACRLALTLLLAAMTSRPLCPARASYDQQLFHNAHAALRSVGKRDADTAAWQEAQAIIRQRLAKALAA